jgi:starch-binding outer membrane protein, SusD/RagB family
MGELMNQSRHRETIWPVRWARRGGLTLALAIPFLGTACDMEVVNPGPVQDRFLNDETAHPSVVNGAKRAVAMTIGHETGYGYTGAAVAREITAAGAVGSFGISVNARRGLLVESQTGATWNHGQRARFVAEDGVRRLRDVLGSAAESSPHVGRLHLWAGFAHRILAEHVCETVIDGGPALPHTVNMEYAGEHFATALDFGNRLGDTDLAMAARAGLAQVSVLTGEWSTAVQYAEAVPRAFVLELEYGPDAWGDHNAFYFAVADQPFRAYTVWNTFLFDYHADTQDPRAGWETLAGKPFGDQGVADYGGLVPFFRQTKYTEVTSPIRLASGREMVLVRAEAELRAGNWGGAVDLINGLRDDVGVAHWTASSIEEAWTALKNERFIELWLEARRLGDLRRWQAEGIPGAEHTEDLESQATLPDQRSTCFPIPTSERETNPNF